MWERPKKATKYYAIKNHNCETHHHLTGYCPGTCQDYDYCLEMEMQSI